jgi:hypothetical protein
MSLALLANTAPRIITILNANPGVWSTSVSGSVGAFPLDSEILAAELEADEWVATRCYFQSGNKSLKTPFATVSSNLVHKDPLPQFHGDPLKAEYSNDGATWNMAVRAAHPDDITNAVANEGYIQTGAFDFLYNMDSGVVLTSAAFVRITYPQYTRTSILQCNKNEESAIVFRSVAILAKHASPALFEKYEALAEAERARIINGGMSQ